MFLYALFSKSYIGLGLGCWFGWLGVIGIEVVPDLIRRGYPNSRDERVATLLPIELQLTN
jgi:hypothetical protein